MKNKRPGFLKMIRAPFLSSIISPLLAGTFLAVYINGSLNVLNFIIMLIMGICLHIATNVYNDIYDTLQGTDKINVHRNEFSGGSGVLLEDPELISLMYNIARWALVGALLTTIALSFLIDTFLLPFLWGLYFLSVFFSKYYTAAPVKLAYRGWGEVSVWFAFGPMAVLVAAVSQNVAMHPIILTAMPINGISTLSILLIGQMIDLDADKATGKWGIAARRGNRVTAWVFIIVQLLLMTNTAVLGLLFLDNGWILLFSLAPYVLLLPTIARLLIIHYNDPGHLKQAAKLNVLLHLLFSLLFAVGLLLTGLLA